jgi:hypothetical protein
LALREGLLDVAPAASLGEVRTALPQWLDQHAGATVGAIQRDGELSDGNARLIRDAVAALLKQRAEHG